MIVNVKAPIGISIKRLYLYRYSILIVAIIILTSKTFLLFSIDSFLGIYSFLTSFLIFSSFIVTYTKYKDLSIERTHNNKLINNNSIKNDFTSKQPLVSVIVAVKNEPIMIEELVSSCKRSTYTSIEIILVNDGSTDTTGKVLDLLEAENPHIVRAVNIKQNVGKRKAIREGIIRGNAKGDIIILMDSDCIVDKKAIGLLVKVFDNQDIGAACGLCRSYNPINTLTKMQDTWYDGQYSIMKGMESAYGTVTCLPGTLSAYRKEAIIPCLDAWCNDKFLGEEFRPGDDRHLTSYIIGGTKHYLDTNQKVWKAVYCENAIVYTEMPTTFKKFIRQQIRWKKSWFRVFFFTVPFYYKNRSFFPIIIYYLTMIWSFASPIAAVRSLIYLP